MQLHRAECVQFAQELSLNSGTLSWFTKIKKIKIKTSIHNYPCLIYSGYYFTVIMTCNNSKRMQILKIIFHSNWKMYNETTTEMHASV